MKTLKLTTHWETEDVIMILDVIDGLRQALLTTYDSEIQQYYDQQAQDCRDRYSRKPDVLSDPLDF